MFLFFCLLSHWSTAQNLVEDSLKLDWKNLDNGNSQISIENVQSKDTLTKIYIATGTTISGIKEFENAELVYINQKKDKKSDSPQKKKSKKKADQSQTINQKPEPKKETKVYLESIPATKPDVFSETNIVLLVNLPTAEKSSPATQINDQKINWTFNSKRLKSIRFIQKDKISLYFSRYKIRPPPFYI